MGLFVAESDKENFWQYGYTLVYIHIYCAIKNII